MAEAGGGIAGHLWLSLIEKVPNPVAERAHHAYATNVYVRPSARSRGLGSALLAEALAWCEARDVDAAILWPTARSRPLYARHGFADAKDVMAANLGASRPIG